MSVSRRPMILLFATMALSMSPLHNLFAQGEKISDKNAVKKSSPSIATEGKKLETATFGGGCFWCVEAVYQRVDGVKSVVSGYAGGHVSNPTYEQVCTKQTGHAEVCQITFDPSVVSFDEMLLIFFKSHDPTTKDQQGADHGPQYRSVVFYNDEAQREATVKMIDKLTEERVYKKKIETEVSPLPDFYPAEANHQNFFKLNPGNAFCRNVIVDKVAKFEKQFKENSKLQKEKEAKKKK